MLVVIILVVEQLSRQVARLEVAHALVDRPPHAVRFPYRQLRLTTASHTHT